MRPVVEDLSALSRGRLYGARCNLGLYGQESSVRLVCSKVCVAPEPADKCSVPHFVSRHCSRAKSTDQRQGWDRLNSSKATLDGRRTVQHNVARGGWMQLVSCSCVALV